MVDHELMESLEYKGEYGARYSCGQCKHCPVNTDYAHCSKQGLEVHWGNDICREYSPKIINSSAPEFNLDDYLEYLYSDYYRPYSYDDSITVGSARLGEVVIDGGKLAENSPTVYQPYYKLYDKPYCRVNVGKSIHVRIGENTFTVDYRRFRELRTIENGEIIFKTRLWKEKTKQRKSNSEHNGIFKLIGRM